MSGRYVMSEFNKYKIEDKWGVAVVKDLRQYRVADVKPGGTISVDLIDGSGGKVTRSYKIFSLIYRPDEVAIVVEDK